MPENLTYYFKDMQSLLCENFKSLPIEYFLKLRQNRKKKNQHKQSIFRTGLPDTSLLAAVRSKGDSDVILEINNAMGTSQR